jgi:aryl-phospho-beta-D-glucosidase BglC (GH1 family)
MRPLTWLCLAILPISFLGSTSASAQNTSLYLEDFTTNQTYRYTFGAFDLNNNPSATSFGPSGVSTNIPASGDSFGGLGVDPTILGVDVTGTTAIQVTARADAGNSSDLVITIREAPDASGEIGEFFSYTVAASNFPTGGGFVTVSINPASGYNGDSTDGVLNGPLGDTGIQSPFGGTAAHHYTVQSVEFVGPPENGDGEICLDPVSTHGALSVSGTNIVDENDRIVSFAGNSMFWSNTGFGAEKYYTSQVVDWLQEDWNATIVRAAMGVDEFGGYLSDPQGNKDRVETIVDAAIANGMYVIIDWHSHHAEDFTSDAVDFFREMAQTYGHHPNVIYEIYNEPLQVSWSGTIKPYAETVIAAIRAIDPDNLIIVGSSNWSQDVDIASQDPITSSTNIAYTLHFYAGTHGQWLREKAETAMNNGLALMVTEWGTVNADGDGNVDFDSTNDWLAFLDMHGISHLNWSVHDKVEGASVLQPNASTRGGWSDSDLTTTGIFVRDIVREWYTCVEPVVEEEPVILGDCNLDGLVDFTDIPAMIELLTSGVYLDQADCNQDGEMDFLDIPAFINILSSN